MTAYHFHNQKHILNSASLYFPVFRFLNCPFLASGSRVPRYLLKHRDNLSCDPQEAGLATNRDYNTYASVAYISRPVKIVLLPG